VREAKDLLSAERQQILRRLAANRVDRKRFIVAFLALHERFTKRSGSCATV